MRRIIRRREVVADALSYPGETPAADTRAVQSFAEFVAAAAAGGVPAPAAVLLGPTDEVETLAPYLTLLDTIVVDFPKLGEGRGFSQARLLRTRLEYRGELRARGVLKRDQLFFLARCGFDSFDLDPAENLDAAVAAFDTFSVAYQGGSDALVHVRHR